MTNQTSLDLEPPDLKAPAPGGEYIGIEQLIPDPNNARLHTQRNLDTIEKSIEETGMWRSIAIDENNMIVAGNATTEVAGQKGITRVRVIDAEPDEIVAVRRSGLTPAQKERYGLFDNRSAEHAEWNAAVIDKMRKEGSDFKHIFSDAELAKIVAQAKLPIPELEMADNVPPKPAEPETQPGDMWLLGRHILVCGDCKDVRTVDRLLGDEKGRVPFCFADPPYNVSYYGKTKDRLTIKNDSVTPEQYHDECLAWFGGIKAVLADGGVYYICHAALTSEIILRSLREVGLSMRVHIVWVKNSMVLGHGDFHWKHEPIAYGWKPGPHYFCGDRSLTTIWEIDRPQASKQHPTMKPVELVGRSLKYSTQPNDLVYDPFGGSGTTVIACEMLDRRARVIEIDPGYCDVIVRRWRESGGEEPRRYQFEAEAA